MHVVFVCVGNNDSKIIAWLPSLQLLLLNFENWSNCWTCATAV